MKIKRSLRRLSDGELAALDLLSPRELLESIYPMKPEDVSRLLRRFRLYRYDSGLEPSSQTPHVRLTTGEHATGYFGISELFDRFPALNWLAARSLLDIFSQGRRRFSWVFGSPESTELARAVAKLTGANHILVGESFGRQFWPKGQQPIDDRSIGLQVENVILGTEAAMTARKVVISVNPTARFHRAVMTVAQGWPENLDATLIGGSCVVSIAEFPAEAYNKLRGVTCDICPTGSVALDPTDPANRAALGLSPLPWK